MNDAWLRKRPVYDRLPRQGYRDNAVADWLTQWVDSELSTVADRSQNLYKQFDPATADAAFLDFLAWCVGMSGDYWDTTWSDSVKRAMITQSYSLWKLRGTEASLRAVLKIHGMEHDIWQQSDLRLPFKLSGKIGTPDLRFIVRLPLKYHRAGKEFAEAQRTIDNFAPAVIAAQVSYRGFYLSFSRLGDPLFVPVPFVASDPYVIVDPVSGAQWSIEPGGNRLQTRQSSATEFANLAGYTADDLFYIAPYMVFTAFGQYKRILAANWWDSAGATVENITLAQYVAAKGAKTTPTLTSPGMRGTPATPPPPIIFKPLPVGQAYSAIVTSADANYQMCFGKNDQVLYLKAVTDPGWVATWKGKEAWFSATGSQINFLSLPINGSFWFKGNAVNIKGSQGASFPDGFQGGVADSVVAANYSAAQAGRTVITSTPTSVPMPLPTNQSYSPTVTSADSNYQMCFGITDKILYAKPTANADWTATWTGKDAWFSATGNNINFRLLPSSGNSWFSLAAAQVISSQGNSFSTAPGSYQGEDNGGSGSAAYQSAQVGRTVINSSTAAPAPQTGTDKRYVIEAFAIPDSYLISLAPGGGYDTSNFRIAKKNDPNWMTITLPLPGGSYGSSNYGVKIALVYRDKIYIAQATTSYLYSADPNALYTNGTAALQQFKDANGNWNGVLFGQYADKARIQLVSPANTPLRFPNFNEILTEDGQYLWGLEEGTGKIMAAWRTLPSSVSNVVAKELFVGQPEAPITSGFANQTYVYYYRDDNSCWKTPFSQLNLAYGFPNQVSISYSDYTAARATASRVISSWTTPSVLTIA